MNDQYNVAFLAKVFRDPSNPTRCVAHLVDHPHQECHSQHRRFQLFLYFGREEKLVTERLLTHSSSSSSRSVGMIVGCLLLLRVPVLVLSKSPDAHENEGNSYLQKHQVRSSTGGIATIRRCSEMASKSAIETLPYQEHSR